jgi:UTP--glucose-1-phosphate uridylyltransferase
VIKKAVIPAAGYGTRFLPATKAQPKEMLPIIDTPVIQMVVQEALQSGIDDVLLITGRGKRAIDDHFDRSLEMEYYLREKGKTEELKQLLDISELINIHTIRQKQTNGLGDAITYARQHIGDEAFAVLLGDTVIESFNDRQCTQQLIDMYARIRRPIIAVEEVPDDKVSRYGIISGRMVAENTYLIDRLVEKPSPEEAPSRLAISGRYILSPEIFDYLDKTPKGVGGELQLTDALNLMCENEQIFAFKFDGRRHDIGNRLDYLKSSVMFALKRGDLKDEFRAFLQEILSLEDLNQYGRVDAVDKNRKRSSGKDAL